MANSRSGNTPYPLSFPLFRLDKNVRKQNVYPHVEIGMWGMLAATCQRAEAETALLRLMTAAVGAEPESYNQADETSLAAIAILKRHPELLFVKGMVTDHFGRKIFASPYRLLLGTGDVWALKQVHEEIIPKIKGGDVLAQDQFQEQFPHCELPFDPELGEAALYDERNEVMIAQVIVQLEAITEAITADPCTNGIATLPETEAAVAALREIFAPKQGEVIRTELHFPLAMMQEIFKEYDDHFYPWTGAQRSFFSREVIGAVLLASTAVDGQYCKVGLRNLDAEKGPDRRDGLFCPHPKGIPLELTPLRGKLGRTMFVDPYGGYSYVQSSTAGYFDWFIKGGRGLKVATRVWVGRGLSALLSWKTYVEKNVRLAELMRPQREENKSRCVI